MTTPWDIGAQFLQLMAQGANRDASAAQQFMDRVGQSEIARQNAVMQQNQQLHELGVRNQYAIDQQQRGHGYNLDQLNHQYGLMGERDQAQQGMRIDELGIRAELGLDEKEYLAQVEAAKAAQERNAVAGRIGRFGGQVQQEPVPVPQRPNMRRYSTSDPTLINTESGGRWNAQNNAVGAGGQRDHFGRIQFGHARLSEAKRTGVIPADMTPEQFMRSPEAQMRTEQWHWNDIDRHIQSKGLDQFIGSKIRGITVTHQGLRNAAHLGGKGGMEKFVRTGGRYDPADSNGKRLSDYLRLGTRAPQAEQLAQSIEDGSFPQQLVQEFQIEPVAVADLGPQMQDWLDETKRTPIARMYLPDVTWNRMSDAMRENYEPDIDMAQATGDGRYVVFSVPSASLSPETGTTLRSDNSRRFGTTNPSAHESTRTIQGPTVEAQTGAGKPRVTIDGTEVPLVPRQ